MKKQPLFFGNIQDKLAFLAECINDVENSIKACQTQQKKHDAEREEQILDLQTDIYALDHYPPGITPQRRTFLESQVKLLEKEKRYSETECLKTVTDLKRELRALKKEHRATQIANL